MSYIKESAKQLEIKGNYDVVVAGGGIAGISAALSAARLGAKTLLVEKQYMLGGLATLGLITIYLPICDGEGRQVSFSIAEELLHLSIKYGWEDKYPKPWLENGTVEEKKKRRFEVQYNANVCAILMEQLLIENGVEILYGSSICSSIVKRDKIKALVIENKSGRYAVECKSVVDATGDADVVHLSGEQTAMFQQKNVLAGWYYYHDKDKLKLKMLGFSDVPDKYKKPEDDQKLPRYEGLEADEVSKMVTDSHKFLLDNFLKDGGITPDHAITTVATIPQVRMTRRICGAYTIDDTEMHKEFSDSIGLISDWRKRGPVYEIPFSTLYGNKIKNLAVAGRCISVTDAMWDITRVIPVCAVTGEAAGAAAAISDNFQKLSVSKLQKILKQRGVVLHEKNL